MSVKTNWDEFENNKKTMKRIKKSFDKKNEIYHVICTSNFTKR